MNTNRMRFAILLITVMTVLAAGTARADVFTNVAEATADGYQLVYDLTIPSSGGFFDTTPVGYSTDNSGSIGYFDRLAYYLELTDGGGTTWAYASMDAFQADAAKVGLPHNVDNPVIHRQVVSNMNVFTSAGAGVTTGTGIQTGYIEMWPSNYSGTTGSLIPTGTNDFDWNDSGMSTNAGYGSFQVHNYDLDGAGPGTDGETIFAYNRFGVGGASDLGIGNNPSGAPDWTLTYNSASYTARRLQVLARPAIIQNGSFETYTTHGLHTTASPFDGNWTIDGEITLVGASWGGPSDGATWLSLQTTGGYPNNVGSISQTFDTMPNQRYLLSFDYAALDPADAGSKTWTLTYDVGGAPIELTIVGDPGAAMLTPWQTEVYEFRATGTSTTLTFTGQTQMGGYWGPAIDNVAAIMIIPEPSTLILAALGLLGLTFVGRRRRK